MKHCREVETRIKNERRIEPIDVDSATMYSSRPTGAQIKLLGSTEGNINWDGVCDGENNAAVVPIVLPEKIMWLWYRLLYRLFYVIFILIGMHASQVFASGVLPQPEFRIWQEEVKLLDGRVIVVTQKKRCQGAYTGGNYAACIAREAWLTINLPEFSNKPIVWHENLDPRIVNIYDGRLYVIGFPPTGREFDMYKNPQPPYVGFILEKNLWKRISFEEIPTAIYDTNMLIESIPPNDMKFLTLEKKEGKAINGDRRYAKHHKRIDPSYRSN